MDEPTKKCPACSEVILEEAKKCKQSGEANMKVVTFFLLFFFLLTQHTILSQAQSIFSKGENAKMVGIGIDYNPIAKGFQEGKRSSPPSVSPQAKKSPLSSNRVSVEGIDKGEGVRESTKPEEIFPSLTRQEISQAIEYGIKYKTRSHYLKKGLKHKKLQFASAFAMDGISKYVTFFTDFDVVAAAAADANHKLRKLTEEEIKELPLTGVLYANVQVHGRGYLPVKKLKRRYTRGDAHLVLKIDGKIIQPLSSQITDERDASIYIPVTLFTWWNTKNMSLLTATPLGFVGKRVELEFAFSLNPEQMAKRATVILIDGDGHHHKKQIDLSKIQKGAPKN